MAERSELTLIGGKPVRYRIKRSVRARHLSLQIDAREGLVVVLPQRMPRREVGLMLAEHAVWIDRQLQRHGVRYGPVRREYATGSEVLLLGEPRRLIIEALPDGRHRARIALEDGTLRMRLPAIQILTPRPALEQWLRQQARRVISARVAALAAELQLQGGKIIIGERTSRWASCSARGNLSFCYRLVMAPLPVVDAVISHELCHLKHLNHGKRFQSMVRRFCPDYDQKMAWLRDHEHDLQL